MKIYLLILLVICPVFLFGQAAHTAKFLTSKDNISLGGVGNLGAGQSDQPKSQSIGGALDMSVGKFMISARIQPNVATNFFSADSFSVYRLNLLNKTPNFYAYLGYKNDNLLPSIGNGVNVVLTSNLLMSYSNVRVNRPDQVTNVNKTLGFSALQFGGNLQIGVFGTIKKSSVDLGKVGILFGFSLTTNNFQNEVSSNRALEELVGLQNNPSLALNKKYGNFTFRTSLYLGDGNVQPFFEINRNFTSNKTQITIPDYINRNFFNIGVSAAAAILFKFKDDGNDE